MRNSRLVCRYALILAAVSVLSFAASDWSRGHLGVSLDLPVASTVHAEHPRGGFWDNFWRNFWNNLADRLNNADGVGGGGSPYQVPEPSTTVLFGIGIAGACLFRRRIKQ